MNATLTKLPAYNVTEIEPGRYHYNGTIYRSQLEIWKARQAQILEMNRYRAK